MPAPRTIEDWEVPYLRKVGAQLKLYRQAAGMTQGELHLAVGMSVRGIQYLEAGEVRPRPSTVRRLVRAMAAHAPRIGDPEALAAEVLELAGPCVAAESIRMARIEKTRDKRVRRLAKDPSAYLRPPPPLCNPELVRRVRIAERQRDMARRALLEAQAEVSNARARTEAQAGEIRRREQVLEAKERALRDREQALVEATRREPQPDAAPLAAPPPEKAPVQPTAYRTLCVRFSCRAWALPGQVFCADHVADY